MSNQSAEYTETAMRELQSGRHGHFAAALAEAWFVADSGNRIKLACCFFDLVAKGHRYAQETTNER
jgi:hypothetical protein